LQETNIERKICVTGIAVGEKWKKRKALHCLIYDLGLFYQ